MNTPKIILDVPRFGIIPVMQWIRSNGCPAHRFFIVHERDTHMGFVVYDDGEEHIDYPHDLNDDAWFKYADGLMYYRGAYGWYVAYVDGKKYFVNWL